MIIDNDCKKSLTKHFRKLFHCLFVIQFEKKISKIIKRITIEIIEIAKLTSNFSNIDIFDSTFVCDILKFDLYNKMINFLQYFQQI